MAERKVRDENMIAALKRERAGYVARGDDDRVAQVDEQLREYGYEGEQDAVVDPSGAPKDRTTRAGRQRTADASKGGTQAGAQAASKTTQTGAKTDPGKAKA